MTEFVLEVLEGDHAGEVIPLDPAGIKMGRKPSNRLMLKDEKVSGEHAEVVLEDGRYVLRDLQSTNGTLIDGHKITEVALSPNDEFMVGRVRIRFRAAPGASAAAAAGGAPAAVAAGAATAAGGADDLQVHRLGQGALQRARKRGGGTLALVLLLVVVAGGAGFLFLRTRGEGGGSIARGRKVPLYITGNSLSDSLAQAENAEPWDLAAAGAAFELGGPGRSSDHALEAGRGEGSHPGFALARGRQPLKVRAGATLKLVGHVRTAGSGQGAVRLRVASAKDPADASGIILVSGTAPASNDAFTEVNVTITIPPGVEEAQIEALALLPSEGARVWIDDVGVIEGTAAAAADRTVAGASLLQLDTAATLVASGEPVVTIRPLVGTGPLAPLGEAGLAALSDAGQLLETKVLEGDGFEVSVRAREGSGAAGGVVLELARDVASSGVLARTDQGFTPQVGAFTSANTTELVVGGGASRLLIRLSAPVTATGKSAGDTFRIALTGSGDELKMSWLRRWAKERDGAAELLRTARAAATPGEALQSIARLQRELPYDEESLRQPLALRAEKIAVATARTEELREEANKVRFFSSRVGFARLRVALDKLTREYGEQLPDAAAVKAMSDEVETRLKAMDDATRAEERSSLAALADRLEKVAQPALAQLVREHLK